MSIDPRLAERRKVVAEDRAQRNVGRLLRVLVIAGVIALAGWIVFSPWLSVSQVRTAGVLASDANRVLAESGVVVGKPMLLIRPGAVEATLMEDPWIRDARVHREWPDEVIVRVFERQPAAWVLTGGGWVRRSVDGAALPSRAEPDESLAKVHLSVVAEDDAATAPLVLGAVEFYDNLPPFLWEGSEMHLISGELWATVAGHDVRLGRPVEMAEKALTLVVLLEQDLRPGEVIVLIAPTNPAIAPPGSQESLSNPAEQAGGRP